MDLLPVSKGSINMIYSGKKVHGGKTGGGKKEYGLGRTLF